MLLIMMRHTGEFMEVAGLSRAWAFLCVQDNFEVSRCCLCTNGEKSLKCIEPF